MQAKSRLAKFRREAGLSQEKLGRQLGVTGAYLAMIEKGRRVPGLSVAAQLEELTARWRLGPIRCAEWAAKAARRPAA